MTKKHEHKNRGKKNMKKKLTYIITRRGLLIIFGSWHTLFMSGVLMAGEHYMLLSNTQIGYTRVIYILFIYYINAYHLEELMTVFHV